jgi:class 3 adenylate cyclase
LFQLIITPLKIKIVTNTRVENFDHPNQSKLHVFTLLQGAAEINRSHENVQMLEKIVDNFSKLLQACVEDKGGHFE